MEAALAATHGGESTHPDIASLVDPLFAAQKEGKNSNILTDIIAQVHTLIE